MGRPSPPGVTTISPRLPAGSHPFGVAPARSSRWGPDLVTNASDARETIDLESRPRAGTALVLACGAALTEPRA